MFLLPPDKPSFPPPDMADESGILAIGGDLSPERLLTAYALGIFPWYDQDSPILWWSPNPRCVLYPAEFHLPSSLRRVINSGQFEIRLDTAFSRVIEACANSPRPGQLGTWIVPPMRKAYTLLNTLGFAHSIEVWQDGELCGGLYGVSLGRAFFGESMFYTVPNASKVAMFYLISLLKEWDFHFLDCQQTSANVLRFGAKEISRKQFLHELHLALECETLRGSWRGAWREPWRCSLK